MPHLLAIDVASSNMILKFEHQNRISWVATLKSRWGGL